MQTLAHNYLSRRRHYFWLLLLFALALAFAQGARAYGATRPSSPASSPSSAPALLQLPAFDGEFSGDWLMPQTGLKFHWHIAAESPANSPGVRRARLDITGHGARVIALAELNLASGVTRWKIESAEVSLAEALSALAALKLKELEDFASLVITGKLVVSGEGSVDMAGKWTAGIVADIRDATVRDDAEGWIVEGVFARVEFPALPSLKTGAAPQPLTVRRFTHGAMQIALEDVRTSFALDEGGAGGALRIRTPGVEARVAGGTVALGAFNFTPSRPAVVTTVQATNIDSAEIARLLPGAVSEARGRFTGAVTLAWDPSAGLRPVNGRLLLQQATDSMMRLAATPGFFTSNMDKRLYFLPPSTGFLRRWISLKNPAYNTLKDIEEGRQAIIVDAVTISFVPEGDSSGRSATVLIEARPSNSRSAIRRLRINVNVSGPLTRVVEMFATGRVQVSF